MQKQFMALVVALSVSFGMLAVPEAHAGLMFFAGADYESGACSYEYSERCNSVHALALIGFVVTVLGLVDDNGTAAVIGLPAGQSSIEGAISTALPYLNTSDVYALGATVRDQMNRGELTRVSNKELGSGLEVKLSKAQVLSVIGDDDYSADQIDRALQVLN